MWAAKGGRFEREIGRFFGSSGMVRPLDRAERPHSLEVVRDCVKEYD
jgi:hypothetical protein